MTEVNCSSAKYWAPLHNHHFSDGLMAGQEGRGRKRSVSLLFFNLRSTWVVADKAVKSHRTYPKRTWPHTEKYCMNTKEAQSLVSARKRESLSQGAEQTL